MDYRDYLNKEIKPDEVKCDFILREEADKCFKNIGFHKDVMDPVFTGSLQYESIKGSRQPCICTSFYVEDNTEKEFIRVYINQVELYIEAETPWRSLESSELKSFESSPTLIQIEEFINSFLKRYEGKAESLCIISKGSVEDTVMDVKDVEQLILKIKEVYYENSICIAEFLESIIKGLSVQETVSVYSRLFEDIENDNVVRITEEGDETRL